MSALIAALPMYDWPERRDEVDAEWAAIRDRLRAAGVDAPDALTRVHDDLLDFWKRPDLLFAQTCWGPMELALAEHVQVIGQPSYDGVEGGQGELYSSAIVMRKSATGGIEDLPPPLTPPLKGEGSVDGHALRSSGIVSDPPSPLRGGVRGGGNEATISLELIRNARLAYNVPDSMSGYIGILLDLAALGESLDIFSERIETGGHRKSIHAVAEGRADVAAIDCMSWRLAKLYEPAAERLEVVGWTSLRKGLPFITAKSTPPNVVAALKQAVVSRAVSSS